MILAVTLNHNQKDLTNNLVRQIRQETQTPYAFWVIDNGSKKHEQSEHTTHYVETNLYFGGGFNYVLDRFLQTDYQYLWFLNNDLLFNGYGIIRKMEEVAKRENYQLLSPSITNAHPQQCHWRQMWNWNTEGTREVKFIDFQAPLMSRMLAEEITKFPELLHLGWGLDFYSGIVCDKFNWKIGVTDLVNLTHLDSRTLKDGKVENYTLNEFCAEAGSNMDMYFRSTDNYDTYSEFREWGAKYDLNQVSEYG